MRRSLAVAAAALAACTQGSLPPATRVDKLRVLAVRAEPPEVAPGGTVALDALVAEPIGAESTPLTYLWLACAPQPGAPTATPCAADADAGAPPSCADQPGAHLCIAGTGAQVTLPVAPATGDEIVTMVVADAQAGGAAGCAVAAAQNGGAPTDADHCVVAVKTVVVSAAPANHNPSLVDVTLGGASIMSDSTARFAVAGAGEPLVAARADGAAEKKPDGTYESLYVSWYMTAGDVDVRRATFYPAACDTGCQMQAPPAATMASTWSPPSTDDAASFAPSGVVRLWGVVHDDRGGVGWLTGSATRQ